MTGQPIEQEPMNLEAKLIEKAMADEAFKRELISNPKAAIAKELGQELPAELEFEVLEQTPTKLYLVLPMSESEASPSEELTEQQLEAVAGGINLTIPGFPIRTIFACPSKGFICWRK